MQITHGRNRAEIARLGLANVEFVDDDWFALALWRSRLLRSWLDVWFSIKAVELAERVASRHDARDAVILQTEPNSPVVPRSLSKRHGNVFGPINGNIYFPPVFRDREKLAVQLRRVLHMPLHG